MKVLLLAGTAEARRLSHELAARPDTEVVVSLAGLTTQAADHAGTVRVGGFGGVDGLAAFLRDAAFDVVVDATHPFATTMPRNAAAACERSRIARLRVVRPPWVPAAGDRWIDVADLDAAARAVRRSGASRVLLTTGRMELEPFAGLDDVALVLRSIEPPAGLPPASVEVVTGRGPFTVDDELALLRTHRIDLVVSKNSGGDSAKLVAARQLDVPVVMIRRPPGVPGPHAATLDDARAWITARSQEAARHPPAL